MAYTVKCAYVSMDASVCQKDGVTDGYWFGASLNDSISGASYTTVNGIHYIQFSSDDYSPYLTDHITSQPVSTYNMQGAGKFLLSTSSYVTYPQWVLDYSQSSPNFSVLDLYSNQSNGSGTSAESLPAPVTAVPSYLRQYYPPSSPPEGETRSGNWSWNGSSWTWSVASYPPSQPPSGETFSSGYYYKDPAGNWVWKHINVPPSTPPTGETHSSGWYQMDPSGNWSWHHVDPPPSLPPAGAVGMGWWMQNGSGGWTWYGMNGSQIPYTPPASGPGSPSGSPTGDASSCVIHDVSSFGSCISDMSGSIAIAVISIAAAIALVYVVRTGFFKAILIFRPKKS